LLDGVTLGIPRLARAIRAMKPSVHKMKQAVTVNGQSLAPRSPHVDFASPPREQGNGNGQAVGWVESERPTDGNGESQKHNAEDDKIGSESGPSATDGVSPVADAPGSERS